MTGALRPRYDFTSMKTGLVSITFRKLSPAEVVALVKQAGLDAIEWGGDIHVPHGNLERAREVATLTREAGLESLCYGSYYRLGDSEEKGLSFSSVLDTAAALGVPSIRVWAGAKASAEADEAYRDKVVQNSIAICEQAARHNITICYEFHGYTLTDTQDSARRLLHDAAHPNLKILWQPPNGMDPALSAAGLIEFLPQVHHLHVFHWWPTSADRFPLAAGAENWSRYLNILRNEKRSLPLLIEFVAGDSTEQFLADAATLKSWATI